MPPGPDIGELRRLIGKAWPIAAYQPSAGQDAFHRSRAGTRVVSGGNRSGKTYCGEAEDCAASLGFRPWLSPDDPDFLARMADGSPMPVPNSGRLCCVDYPNALTHAIYPTLMKLAPSLFTVKNNAQGYPTHWQTAWGSDIFVMSYDQDWRKYESGTYHWVHFDEPPPRTHYIGMLRGLATTAGPMWMTMTPHSEEWLLEEVYGAAEEEERSIEVFRLKTADNPAMTAEGLRRFEAALTPMERAIRLYGETALLGGRCLPDFQEKAPWVCGRFQVPREGYRIMCVDPHEEKPDAVLWMWISPTGDRAVVYDEVMDDSTRGSVAKTAATIRVREREHRMLPCRRLIDPRAASKQLRGVERTILDEFRVQGIRLEPAPGLKVSKGMRLVNDWFSFTDQDRPWLQVFDSCKRTIAECRHLTWVRDPKNYELKVRTKGPDDMVSCLRYIATWGPHIEKLGASVASDEWDEDEGVSGLDVVHGDGLTSGSWTGY